SNIALRVFKGPSPQFIFNCLSPNDPSPNNGLDDFRNCQVRVSGGTPGDTPEQAYFSIVLPDAPVATTTTTSTTTTTTVPTSNQMGSCAGFQSIGTSVPPLPASGGPVSTVAALKTAKTGLVVWGPGFGAQLTTTGNGSCTIGTNTFNDVQVGAKLSGVAS